VYLAIKQLIIIDYCWLLCRIVFLCFMKLTVINIKKMNVNSSDELKTKRDLTYGCTQSVTNCTGATWSELREDHRPQGPYITLNCFWINAVIEHEGECNLVPGVLAHTKIVSAGNVTEIVLYYALDANFDDWFTITYPPDASTEHTQTVGDEAPLGCECILCFLVITFLRSPADQTGWSSIFH